MTIIQQIEDGLAERDAVANLKAECLQIALQPLIAKENERAQSIHNYPNRGVPAPIVEVLTKAISAYVDDMPAAFAADIEKTAGAKALAVSGNKSMSSDAAAQLAEAALSVATASLPEAARAFAERLGANAAEQYHAKWMAQFEAARHG